MDLMALSTLSCLVTEGLSHHGFLVKHRYDLKITPKIAKIMLKQTHNLCLRKFTLSDLKR